MMITHLNCVKVLTLTPPITTPTKTLGLRQLFLMLLLTTGIRAAGGRSSKSGSPPIALPGCRDRCGDIPIPYPFGIGSDPKCFLNRWYRVICTTHDYWIPKDVVPQLASLVWKYRGDVFPVGIKWIETTPITLPSAPTTPLLTLSIRSPMMDGGFSKDTGDFRPMLGLDMRESPFSLMPLLNTLTVFGCNRTAILKNILNQTVAGCTSVCTNSSNDPATYRDLLYDSDVLRNIKGSSCYGIKCCQSSIPKSLDYFQFQTRNTLESYHSYSLPFLANTSFLSDPNIVDSTSLLENATAAFIWKVYDWPHNLSNSATTKCSYYNDTLLGGGRGSYICQCKHPYTHGNPYLPQGCQVIKECNKCPDDCRQASSINQTYGCPIIPVYPIHNQFTLQLFLGLGISLGSIFVFIILYGLFRVVKARKDIRVKHSNFRRNGGMLLQQQMSSGDGVLERIKMFTCDELERATDNFNQNRVLGRGGQGTVYKGMLPDGTIVAIKKSRVDKEQSDEFINEVVILSQIKHRNVVKLFGCCLETRVPLLVYEFVLNGTLYEHIHNPKEDFRLTWKMRLQIAIESAEALRYFHSSSSNPIYHRDIKTSNILLDDRYRAKIADFGISRTTSIDQTHVTTNLQGTWGYIDPEYFQSNQFSEKSDVYSFGVVLLELLSSKKPIRIETSTESKTLISEFFLCMQQARLFDIVDANVLSEARVEEIEGFADLAKRCLSLNGSQRPAMKEVAMTLQLMASQNEVPHRAQEEHVYGDDQVYLVDEDPLNIVSASPTLDDDFSRYTLPFLFHTN